MDPRQALLIAVDDYSALEREAGLPPGSLALRGPRNDLVGWYSLLRELGVPAAQITVLSTPALTPAELGEPQARCGVATPEAVRRALCGADSEDEGETSGFLPRLAAGGAAGLGFVVAIGHGGRAPQAGLQVLLAEATPRDQAPVRAGALDVEALHALVAARAPEASFVCLVDACRAGRGAAGPSPTLTHPRHLLVTASDAGEMSFEGRFERRWRSHFSWAAQQVLGQWQARGQADGLPGETLYLDISYRRLLDACQTLMSVFVPAGAAQRPRLLTAPTADRAAIEEGAFLLPFSARGQTSASPAQVLAHYFGEGTTDFTTRSGQTIASIYVDLDDSSVWEFATDQPFDLAGERTLTVKNNRRGRAPDLHGQPVRARYAGAGQVSNELGSPADGPWTWASDLLALRVEGLKLTWAIRLVHFMDPVGSLMSPTTLERGRQPPDDPEWTWYTWTGTLTRL